MRGENVTSGTTLTSPRGAGGRGHGHRYRRLAATGDSCEAGLTGAVIKGTQEGKIVTPEGLNVSGVRFLGAERPASRTRGSAVVGVERDDRGARAPVCGAQGPAPM